MKRAAIGPVNRVICQGPNLIAFSEHFRALRVNQLGQTPTLVLAYSFRHCHGLCEKPEPGIGRTLMTTTVCRVSSITYIT
jgi:hypothetical protein